VAHHLEQQRYKSATKLFLQFGLQLTELEKQNSKSLQKKGCPLVFATASSLAG
jgi:hypothetical protein